ncbi:MAG: AAA family ATPase [Deltaproteobacteria bacterium]|nr:AAA family ATPase [Deltaproteobacteria bacterium]
MRERQAPPAAGHDEFTLKGFRRIHAMYEEFYGFRDNPFRLTPDPDYLFLSTNHQEALGHLLFGVREGSGVVVITGEIGAGKTMLLRTLVRNLDSNTIVAYIFNPALSAVELLQTINADLGLPSSSTSKKELIEALNRFLLDQQAAGRRVVVIVDEAQDLEPSVLEQLRLLSNLETERAKLLQIMLVGQPELRDILARPDLAQLDQRVTLRWHLGPLNEEETKSYVRHRVRVAADGRELVHFSADALTTVYRISHGIPRLVNILCHRALLIGYTREERRIEREAIRQAAKELGREEPSFAFQFPRFLSSPAAVGVLVLLAAAMLAFASTHGWLFFPRSQTNKAPVAITQTPPAQSAPPATNAKATTPTDQQTAPTEAVAATAPAPAAPSTGEPLSQPASLSPSTSVATPTPPASTPGETAAMASPGQEEGDQKFFQALQQKTAVDSAVQATDALLRAWSGKALQGEEWRSGTMDLSAIAKTRRLEYLPLNSAFNLLSLLDLPAILELTTPANHEPRFALLVGITDGRCRFLLDREWEVPMSVLTEHWFGKAHLFWKDFENVGAPLGVGSVGQQVKRLYRLLAQTPGGNVQLSPDTRLDTYSRKTEDLVARFQKSRRLTPDGVVGPQTMITLYNAVSGYSRPSLTVSPPSSPGRETEAHTSQDTPSHSREHAHEHNS